MGNELGFPVVGVASTIDNDLYGSEIAIGVDIALNIALEAIDRLKITASSHHRAFLVEVMGRDCGYLALMAGIAAESTAGDTARSRRDRSIGACEPGALMGLVRGEVMAIPLREVMSRKKAPDLALLELAGVLAR